MLSFLCRFFQVYTKDIAINLNDFMLNKYHCLCFCSTYYIYYSLVNKNLSWTWFSNQLNIFSLDLRTTIFSETQRILICLVLIVVFLEINMNFFVASTGCTFQLSCIYLYTYYIYIQSDPCYLHPAPGQWNHMTIDRLIRICNLCSLFNLILWQYKLKYLKIL